VIDKWYKEITLKYDLNVFSPQIYQSANHPVRELSKL